MTPLELYGHETWSMNERDKIMLCKWKKTFLRKKNGKIIGDPEVTSDGGNYMNLLTRQKFGVVGECE
jgi:hypothetical protein